jgi:hypothetical protein
MTPVVEAQTLASASKPDSGETKDYKWTKKPRRH